MKDFISKKRKLALFLALIMVLQILAPNLQNVVYANPESETEAEVLSETEGGQKTENPEETGDSVNEGEQEPEVPGDSEVKEGSEKEEPEKTEGETEDLGVTTFGLGDGTDEEPEFGTLSNGDSTNLGNIFTHVKLILNGVEINTGDTIEIDENTEIGMVFDWKLADSVDLEEGDYAEIEIPSIFNTSVIPDGFLRDPDNIIIGSYEFDNGILRVKFNDKLVGLQNREGQVGFDMKFDLSDMGDEIEKEIEFGEPINKTFKVKVKVDGEDIDKTGALAEGANPKTINWEIIVNTNLKSLEDGKVVDATPEGLELVENSFEIYELEVNNKGVIISEELITNPDLTFFTTPDGFEYNLGKTDKAYKITYTTNIIEYKENGYINKAILMDNDEEKANAEYTVDQIEQQKDIEKKGSIASMNPKTVTWTIDVNKTEQNLTNAQVIDELPDGLELKSIKIYELNYVDGSWVQGNEASITANAFPIVLGNIDSAYRIVVETNIDFSKITLEDIKGGKYFTNEATLRAKEIEDTKAQDTVDATWDKLVTKSGKDITSYGDRIMEWTVTLNSAQLKINGAKFIDIVGDGQELLDGIVITGVSGYEVKDKNFDFSYWNLDLPEDVEYNDISFGIDLGTIEDEVTIKYRTKITDLNIEEYTNRALLYGWLGGEGDGPGVGGDLGYLEDQGGSGNLTVKNNYQKSFKGINYDTKRMSWEIVVDAKEEEITELTITDTFIPAKTMKFIKDTLVVKAGNDILTAGTDFILTDNGVDGFVIEFKALHKPLKRAKYVITFETSFDPDTVLAGGGVLNTDIGYTNKAHFTGKTATKDIDVTDTAKQNITTWISNKGQKKGNLNRAGRLVAWEIYINPLGQDLTGEEFKIVDNLSEGQVFDEASLEVYKYTFSSNGTVQKGDLIPASEYSLDPTSDEGFTLTFSNGISTPVLVEFDSDIVGLSKEKYENTADVTGKDTDEIYKANVTYTNHDKFVDKNSDVSGGIAYTDNDVNWSVTVNDSLSEITNAVFRDKMSPGQILDHSSIRVNGAEVATDDLDIVTTEEGTFIEIRLGDIDSRKTITYTTIVTASTGTISNEASLYGSEQDLGESSEKEYEAKASSWGTGTGDKKRGSIEITKVKADGGDVITLPTEFELYYIINGVKQVVTGDSQTTENGKVQYGNLPFRTYYLREVDPPTGYKASEEERVIELNNDSREIKLDYNNEKLKTKVTGTKTWKDPNSFERPDSIDVELTRKSNGQKDNSFSEIETVSPITQGIWEYEFIDLDEYDDAGHPYEYMVEELGVPEEYESKVDGHNIINTRVGKIEISGEKRWLDQDDSDRPDTITVMLYRNDVYLKEQEVSPTQGKWDFVFTNLDEFDEDGQPFTYAVKEKAVDGYTSVVEDYDIKNIRSGNTEVKITKEWLDDDSPERPDNITVYLKRNGGPFNSIILNEGNNWTYENNKLKAFDDEGQPYVYTIDEKPVAGYETTIDGFEITNLRVGKVDIPIEKRWEEVDSRYRPESITVELLANGVVEKTQEIAGNKNDAIWNYTFDGLDKYDDQGKEITYSVNEVNLPTGYESVVEGMVITNTQESTEIAVEKKWNEVDKRYRPDSITVRLLADGVEKYKEEITGNNDENSWLHTFENLAKYDKNGKEIEYTVEEMDALPGYDVSIVGTVITNTQKTTELSGEKVWEEVDDRYRPDSITVQLLANGEAEEGKTTTTSAAEDWLFEFTDLARYDKAGNEIIYEVKEINLPPGYDPSVDDTIILNKQKETDLSGKKIWDEVDPRYRPDEVTIELLVNGEPDTPTKQKVISEATEWKYTFDKLAKYDKAGVKINYTVREVDVPAGYKSAVEGNNVTNTQIKTEVTGEKKWDEVDSRYRPDTVTIQLLANGKVEDTTTTSAAKGWRYAFEDLAMYDKAGKEIVYTVEEIDVPAGYKSSVEGHDIINTQIKTEVTGEKKWDEVDKRYRPDSVTIQLLANGEVERTETITAADNWTFSFKNLAEYDQAGEKITYTVKEVDVPEGYESAVDGTTITNTQKTTEISGEKIWKEVDKRYRPDTVTIQLLANGKVEEGKTITTSATEDWLFTFENLAMYDKDGKEIKYTVVEVDVFPGYEVSIEGTIITNTQKTTDISGEKIWKEVDKGYRPVSVKIQLLANGEVEKTITTNHKKGWKYTFKDLAKYDKDGKKIKYTVQELNVPEGYESVVKGNNIINKQITTDISGEKIWKEVDKGYRPKSITVQLFANGQEKETVKVTAETKWKYSFKDLAIYDQDGKEIKYTVKELNAPKGYESSVKGNNIINKQKTTEISGEKIWKDVDKGYRPKSITVQLFANGQEKETVKVTAANNWKYTFADLVKYDGAGKEIKYTVKEINVPKGYKSTVKGNNIINKQKTTEVSGEKIWKDVDKGYRPKSITVQLLANGQKKETIEVTAANNWKYTFKDLAKYDQYGKEIKYTVRELNVPKGYESTVKGNNIINLRVGKTKLEGKKIWLDDNSKSRPKSIEVILLANGKATGKSVKVTAFNNWKYKFNKLDKYDDQGKEIIYTVKEKPIPGYKSIVKGSTITNLRVGKTKVTGKKIWQGGPENKPTIELQLYRNGKEFGKPIKLKDGQTQYTWVDLEQYDNLGRKYVYTVDEAKVPENYGKSRSDDGLTVTNIYKSPEIDITARKVWVGTSTKARPTIELQLYRNGKAYGEPVQLVDGQYEYVWKKLDRTDNKGIDYKYTVKEVGVPEGYKKVEDGLTVTNTLKTYAIGDYTWIDTNKDGIQDSNEPVLPGVIVELYNGNGEKIAETITDENGRYIFDDLPAGRYQVKFILTEEQAEKYEFTKQNAGSDSAVDSDPQPNTGWTRIFELGDNTVTKNYNYQKFNATEGIDPTWDAGVIEKEKPVVPEEPDKPVVPGKPEEPGKPVKPGGPKLPDTGSDISGKYLVLGAVLLALGLFLRRRKTR